MKTRIRTIGTVTVTEDEISRAVLALVNCGFAIIPPGSDNLIDRLSIGRTASGERLASLHVMDCELADTQPALGVWVSTPTITELK